MKRVSSRAQRGIRFFVAFEQKVEAETHNLKKIQRPDRRIAA
jgi:hypothetical protein